MFVFVTYTSFSVCSQRSVALVCFAYGDEVKLDDADPLLELLQLAKEVGVEALGNVAVNNTK